MTNEADDVADPNQASTALVELVAKREVELRGKPAPASEATKPVEKPKVVQAEEVEAEGTKPPKAPEEGKPEEGKKALDVEWTKSETLKRRLAALHETGNLDDEVLGLLKDGARSKEIVRGANKKFEEAAEKVKAANTERDVYRERAERYDRLMADPKFHAAMQATEEVKEDESFLTPEEKRLKRLEKDLEDMKAEKAKRAKDEESSVARVKEIEGWAEDHRSSLGDAVSLEEYEAALKGTLKEMLEEDLDPRQTLTQRGLVRRVNRVLERQREEKDVQSLRERVGESNRDAVRSARASSPAGVRTEVEKQYATPKAKRIAETLAKYPLRPD